MNNLNSDNHILSASILIQSERLLVGSNAIDTKALHPLVKLMEKLDNALSTNAIRICYKLPLKDLPVISSYDPAELSKGILALDFSFEHNSIYQKNLLLDKTELNKTLLDYIESAFLALREEESLAVKDINTSYKRSRSIDSIFEIKNAVIYYSVPAFPKFVHALGGILKGLNKINPEYKLLICNKTHHFFASTIEAHASPTAIEHECIHELTGYITPTYKHTDISNYTFYEHYTNDRYSLTTSVPEMSSLLSRVVRYNDPVSIQAKLVEHTYRDRTQPNKRLKLHDIITKTQESRDRLARSLKPLL